MNATANNRSPIFRRAAWLAWSGAINLANNVLLWMVMARWRSAAEVGRFTIVISVWMAFVSLCSLGLGSYLVSEITRRKTQTSSHDKPHLTFIASASLFLLLCSFGFAVLMGGTGILVSDAAEVRLTIMLLSLTLPLTGLLAVAEAVFIARGKTQVIALANTVENGLRTFVPLLLVA